MEKNMLKLRKIFSFIVLSLVFCLPVFSKDNEFNHSFQVRPLVYILNNFLNSILDGDSKTYSFELSFEYQYLINNKMQLSISPFFSMGNYISEKYFLDNGILYENETIYYYKETSFGIAPGIIIRPFGNGLRGFYIKPYPIIEFHRINYLNYNFKDTNFTIGLIGESGYQWILKNGFTIALGGGIGNRWLLANKKENYIKTSFLKIDLNFSLGYSF